jgi:hypothetical protein
MVCVNGLKFMDFPEFSWKKLVFFIDSWQLLVIPDVFLSGILPSE